MPSNPFESDDEWRAFMRDVFIVLGYAALNGELNVRLAQRTNGDLTAGLPRTRDALILEIERLQKIIRDAKADCSDTDPNPGDAAAGVPQNPLSVIPPTASAKHGDRAAIADNRNRRHNRDQFGFQLVLALRSNALPIRGRPFSRAIHYGATKTRPL